MNGRPESLKTKQLTSTSTFPIPISFKQTKCYGYHHVKLSTQWLIFMVHNQLQLNRVRPDKTIIVLWLNET